MTTIALRTRLYDIIRNADDDELLSIYDRVGPKNKEKSEWWKDKQVLADLDERSLALNNGTDKGYTINELAESIEKLRQKRNGK